MEKFKTGELIDRRYQVLSTLGEGGMGVVYKVSDTMLSETVALKTLLPCFAENREALTRFINEVRVSIKLTHPNIVRVYDIRRMDSLYYMTMEFIDGYSLHTWLRQGSSRDVPQVLDILRKVCNGLAYAHRMGTVHRDIKPSNVMLTKRGGVFLVDFGLAKLADGVGELTRLGGAGTPSYMAPEQKSGGDIDQRADIYSVAVMAFEMLTGALPKLVMPSQLNPTLNTSVDEVLARAMAPLPANRYANMSVFLEDLQSALTARVVQSAEAIHEVEGSDEPESPEEQSEDEPEAPPGMVVVPSGHFWMGSSLAESKNQTEKPRHRVFLPRYYIDTYPVTNEAYLRFVRATGHPEPLFWDDPRFNDPLQPVVGVSWYDAMDYAVWANKRLPTEAEWEKAAKGENGLICPWGNEFDVGLANIDSVMESTSAVGEFASGASPYGCLDLIGNVWEWCFDWFDESYYSLSPVENPSGPEKGDRKVLRGGAWDTIFLNARNAFRFFAESDTKALNIGFRCATDG
jgi:serine/threonine-protein kinase